VTMQARPLRQSRDTFGDVLYNTRFC